MRRTPRAAALAAGLTVTLSFGTLGLAACGDDDATDSPTGTTCPPEASGGGAADQAIQTTLVGPEPDSAGGVPGGNANVGNQADTDTQGGGETGAGDAGEPSEPGQGDNSAAGDLPGPTPGAGSDQEAQDGSGVGNTGQRGGAGEEGC